MVPLRQAIGEVLRDIRQRQGRTLREVSQRARVSLGYLSEVERGQKEASSELLAWICQALETPMYQMLREVPLNAARAGGSHPGGCAARPLCVRCAGGVRAQVWVLDTACWL